MENETAICETRVVNHIILQDTFNWTLLNISKVVNGTGPVDSHEQPDLKFARELLVLSAILFTWTSIFAFLVCATIIKYSRRRSYTPADVSIEYPVFECDSSTKSRDV